MSHFIHFVLLVTMSFSCPLLNLQVKIADGSLISPVGNNGRPGTIGKCAMFRTTSRSRKEAKVAIEMVVCDFCFIRNRNLLLHSQDYQARPGLAALEETYLEDLEWDDVKAASEETGDHKPVFQSSADSIPSTPTFTWFLQSNQLKKQKFKVFPATLGAKKLNMTQIGSAWITDLFHSISPRKFSSMQDIYGTKTYIPEQGQIFHNFKKRSRSNFRSIHPDYEEHDEPGIFVSQAYNPVRALFCNPDATNLFQRIAAAKTGVKLKKTFGKVEEYVNVIGMTHQGRYGIKDLGFSGTIDVEAPCLNSIKILKDVLFSAQPWQAERRRRIVTSRAEPIWMGVTDQTTFLQFVKVESDPRSHATSYDGFSIGVLEEARKIADLSNDLNNFSSFMGEYDVLVKQITLWKFVGLAGDVAFPKKRTYTDFSEASHMQPTKRRRRILTSRSEPIRVFEEAMNIVDVKNDFTYNYYSFDGEYDDLVKQRALGKFDVVAGDVTILEERQKYADFSLAYTESGMVLVVPIRSRLPIQMWLFMNPFTTELWGLILAITIYNGFIVWLIERNYNPEFRSGTLWNQFGTLFWPASTTLFTLSADKLQSKLSRMVMVVWLFVALILTQSYLSILSNMLTAQRLAPATKDVESLKNMNATVGYCRGAFLESYMINALGFSPAQIKKYSSTSASAKALKTGEIAGIFLEVPSAKLFLAQYCKSFMTTEKIFKVGGYGFAFKKNFPLLPDINKAILKISENGKLLELEERYINSKECAEPVLFSNEDASIGLDSFAILFVLSGCTSTVALAIYISRYIICLLSSTADCSDLFKRVSTFTKRWIDYRRPSSAIVISLENPGNPPDAPCPGARQFVSTTDAESLEDHPQTLGQ
nr:PREDICTED: glutamate receptor 2.8-like isoform X2 [Daucus carota subsp. sativus]